MRGKGGEDVAGDAMEKWSNRANRWHVHYENKGLIPVATSVRGEGVAVKSSKF